MHGAPRLDVLEALASLRRDGWKILVHTTRSDTDRLRLLESSPSTL